MYHASDKHLVVTIHMYVCIEFIDKPLFKEILIKKQ